MLCDAFYEPHVNENYPTKARDLKGPAVALEEGALPNIDDYVFRPTLVMEAIFRALGPDCKVALRTSRSEKG